MHVLRRTTSGAHGALAGGGRGGADLRSGARPARATCSLASLAFPALLLRALVLARRPARGAERVSGARADRRAARAARHARARRARATVRRYLREFLGDPRVLDMPAPAPPPAARARRSCRAGRARSARGLPEDLDARGLAAARAQPRARRRARARARPRLRGRARHALRRARARAAPSPSSRAAGAERIVVLPLFPQYAAVEHRHRASRAPSSSRRRAGTCRRSSSLAAFYDEPGLRRRLGRGRPGAPRRLPARPRAALATTASPSARSARAIRRGGHCLARAGLLRRARRREPPLLPRPVRRHLARPRGGARPRGASAGR